MDASTRQSRVESSSPIERHTRSRTSGLRLLGVVVLGLLLALAPSPASAQSGQTPPLDQWMGSLADNPTVQARTLMEFVFPGSHGAGTYGLVDYQACEKCAEALDQNWFAEFGGDTFRDATISPIALGWQKNQSATVLQQLRNGARAFDLQFFRATPGDRSVFQNGGYYIHNGLGGPPEVEVFDDIREFLEQPGTEHEVLVLHVRNMFEGNGDMSGASLAEFFRRLFYWVSPVPGDVSTFVPWGFHQTATMGQVWASGKRVIVVYDDPTPPAWTASDIASGYPDLVWTFQLQHADFTDLAPADRWYPRADNWKTDDKLFTLMKQLSETRDWGTGPVAMFEMGLQFGRDREGRGAFDSWMMDRYVFCNLTSLPVNAIVEMASVLTGANLDPQLVNAALYLVDGIQIYLAENPGTAFQTAAALQALILAYDEVLDQIGMCPAVNDDWDRFGSLAQVAGWTNPKLLPQLVGLNPGKVNIVLADFYPADLTRQAIALNAGAARVNVTIDRVEELECHDCLSLTPDPDYYPRITFSDHPAAGDSSPFVTPWPVFGGPHLEYSGTDIQPFWMAMHTVPLARTNRTVDVTLEIIDQDNRPDSDDPSQIDQDGNPYAHTRSVPVAGCDPIPSNCGSVALSSPGAVTAGPMGLSVFNSSRLTYSIDVCEWSRCDPGAPLQPPVAVITAPEDTFYNPFNGTTSYLLFEGQSVRFSAENSYDPEWAGSLRDYEWDCDYSGEFIPGRGCNRMDRSGIGGLLYFTPPDGPRELTVALRVTGVNWRPGTPVRYSAVATHTVHIANMAPTIDAFALPASSGALSVPVTFAFGDRGWSDGPFTCEVYYSGYMAVGQVAAAGIETEGDPELGPRRSNYTCTVTLAFPYSGTFDVFPSVRDKDGAEGGAPFVRYIVGSNTPPVANAGPDVSFDQTAALGASITLDGRGSSDVDGDALVYTWFEAGMVIGSQALLSPAKLYAPGLYSFALRVEDGRGGSSVDLVAVTVTANLPPKAVVTMNGIPIVPSPQLSVVQATSPDSDSAQVTLDASASTDPEGQALTFRWAVTSHYLTALQTPAVEFTGPQVVTTLLASDKPLGSPLRFDSNHVALWVSDGAPWRPNGVSRTYYIAVNRPPAANAGGAYTGVAGEPIVLAGTGSDRDSWQEITLTWAFGDGEAGSGPAPSHVYAAAGTYTAELTVTDGWGGVSTSRARVEVTVPPVDPPPVAVACDVNNDGMVNTTDLTLIRAKNNQAAAGADDPFDPNHDGRINIADLRYCQLRMTR